MKTLSRDEMKNLLGGNAPLPGCENGQAEWHCGTNYGNGDVFWDFCSCSTGGSTACHVYQYSY